MLYGLIYVGIAVSGIIMALTASFMWEERQDKKRQSRCWLCGRQIKEEAVPYLGSPFSAQAGNVHYICRECHAKMVLEERGWKLP